MIVSILNAGGQSHYLYGLVSGLNEIEALEIEVVDRITSISLLDSFKHVKVFPLRGSRDHNSPLLEKILRIVKYYFKLIRYAFVTRSKLFHIQWENKFLLFDRTLLIIYYKLLGKKIVFTAHNVDAADRDGKSHPINKYSLWFMYTMVDHVIVHTDEMKNQLCEKFHVGKNKVCVIPHGINNKIQKTALGKNQARDILRIDLDKKLLLIFGWVDRYKGVDLAIQSMPLLVKDDPTYFLLIVGQHKDCPDYIHQLEDGIRGLKLQEFISLQLKYIPDDEIERYFVAADCAVLPYCSIFQSGVPFLAFQFGLPIIATDIGSFRQTIIENENGYLCKPEDPNDLAATIKKYFQSALYQNLASNRDMISNRANELYSGIG